MQPHFSGDTRPERQWVTNCIEYTRDALRMPRLPAHLCYTAVMEADQRSSPKQVTRENTRMGSHSLLQKIFPTQGLNARLLYCRQIPYHLSLQGSLNKREGPQKGILKASKMFITSPFYSEPALSQVHNMLGGQSCCGKQTFREPLIMQGAAKLLV